MRLITNAAIAISTFALAALSCRATSPDFDKHFCDTTLRIDYILCGNHDATTIALDGMSRSPQWVGRRHNLDKLAVRGAAQIAMTDAASTDTIYRHSFCTLYQEWLDTTESMRLTKGMETSALLPMPVKPANVTIALLTEKGDTLASMTHRVDPADILIRRIGETEVNPYRYIHRATDPRDGINVVIVPEGYTAQEMDTFMEHAAKAAEYILGAEPFSDYADHINLLAAEIPSQQSGVSVPKEGLWRDTPLGAHFSTFYSDRYLTVPRLKTLHDLLAGIPYEHIIILANTPTYGGGGIYNFYTTTTARHKHFKPVVVHEFGHSFAGLGDEYAYYAEGVDLVDDSVDYEPWQQNVTSLVDFDQKWADMLPESTPIPTPDSESDRYPTGVYQGANYNQQLYYRPAYDCRMRTNTADGFCPVCVRAITRVLDFYLNE